MFWLGTQAPKDIAEAKQTGVTRPSLHSPLFKPVPGPSIETGVRAMSRAVMGLMGK
jgi:hippurate hydrolase